MIIHVMVGIRLLLLDCPDVKYSHAYMFVLLRREVLNMSVTTGTAMVFSSAFNLF